MDIVEAKQQVREVVERLAPTLIDVSHQIHANPELGFEEQFAHALLTETIEGEGHQVQRAAHGLATAFDARIGSGSGPTIAVLCEYDALPGLGHACGHNIIAAAGLGAGLAAATVADACGGRLALMGTPAEEGGGGKELMIRAGAFEDVDAAMMVHPANHELRTMHTIAVQTLSVRYHGREAHAAAAPHKGLNALDAAVLGYNAVAALRQHIRPDERIHGIFTSAGDKPNIVPEFAAADWYVRSPSFATLSALKERVLACLEAGASAAGCTMEHEWVDPAFADMVDSNGLLDMYVANARRVGRDPRPEDPDAMVVGSTDMGNVSHVTPSIHPMIKVAPDDVPIHTAAFAEHACSETGDAAVLDGAAAMAMTVVDCWFAPDAVAALGSAHRAQTAGEGTG